MPNDKNLLARFTLLEKAQACRSELWDQGFRTVQIDNIPSLESSQLQNQAPLVEWGRYGYQFDQMDDKWTAASSWGNDGLIGGDDWLLTAVVPQDRASDVADIIRQHDGRL